MKKLFKITEHPIIAGILLLIIGSVGYGAIFAKLKIWGQTILNGLNYKFTINFEITIWVLLVFVFGAVGLWFLFKAWQGNNMIKVIEEEVTAVIEEATADEMVLNKNEKLVLDLFSNSNGSSFTLRQIAFIIKNEDMLVAEQTVRYLMNKHFLKAFYNTIHETTYELTSAGTDYILEHLRQ